MTEKVHIYNPGGVHRNVPRGEIRKWLRRGWLPWLEWVRPKAKYPTDF